MIRLLLDTHAVIWLLSQADRIAPEVHAAITAPEAEIWVSVASIWEAEIKQAAGKLTLPPNLWNRVNGQGSVFSPLI